MRQRVFAVPPLDEAAGAAAKAHVDILTKPPGSLGRLEQLAIELARMTADAFPRVSPPGVLVFAADHGVVAEGVSAFPQEVTAQMVLNFLNGGAAINVFARQIGAMLKVVDVGVASDVAAEGAAGYVNSKVRYGTANFVREPAMSPEEADKCVRAGYDAAVAIVREGAKAVIIGEMGIGNTTASSAMLAVLTGKPVESVVGRGTGVADDGLARKINAIRQAIEARRPNPEDPMDVLRQIGGLEIGAMAGAVLGAAANRIPVVADGFISTVAALLAVRLNPAAVDYLLVGHHSQEPGHKAALDALGKHPLIDLGMRLGEGSGAAVAFTILESACRMMREMATFSSAGISGKLEK